MGDEKTEEWSAWIQPPDEQSIVGRCSHLRVFGKASEEEAARELMTLFSLRLKQIARDPHLVLG